VTQKLTPKERLEEMYERHNRMYDKAQADHKRLRAIAKVRIARDEKEHRKSDDGQSTEK
jgi:hypothetical protein